MSLIHQTPLPNWFNVLLNWGPSNYKRASCDSLGKDKKVQEMFFPKFCFELELCPMTRYYSKWREHKEAINLQRAELFELPRRLMPSSEHNGTQWHFQKDLVNAPLLFLSSSFYSSISVILEFIRKSLMKKKKVNIVLLFYSTHPKIIPKIWNLFFKKVIKRNIEYRI